MVLEWIVRRVGARRFPGVVVAAEAVDALAAGRRRAAIRLLVLAAVTWRWRAAGVVLEVGRRFLRRRTGS